MSLYPEHDKLAQVEVLSQAQGEILIWLKMTKGISIPGTVNEILAEYHGIDLEKFEQERQKKLQEWKR
jgi:hypothetical protein